MGRAAGGECDQDSRRHQNGCIQEGYFFQVHNFNSSKRPMVHIITRHHFRLCGEV
jgi:hypothetical protein